MEVPASERAETTAPTQAAPTQAAGGGGAEPHDTLADPPADWPKEGPFDDPTQPEKAYVEAAVREALSSKLGLAAGDDRVFAEAAPGGPASAADDREAREMLRYLDEEAVWHEEWPPFDFGRGSPENAAERLPIALELNIEHARYGRITRLLRLPDAAEQTMQQGLPGAEGVPEPFEGELPQ